MVRRVGNSAALLVTGALSDSAGLRLEVPPGAEGFQRNGGAHCAPAEHPAAVRASESLETVTHSELRMRS